MFDSALLSGELLDFGSNKDPKSDDATAATDAAGDRMIYAPFGLLTEEPTTLLGVAALLDYVAQPDYGHGRVEMWRGGGRPNISVSASFVWRCLSGSAVTSVSTSRSSNRTSRFPASGSRTRLHAFV
jgi:hypothetical protein